MNYKDTIKECRILAKANQLEFSRSKAINNFNGKACYQLRSNVEYKVWHIGCLQTIYHTLLSL